MRTILALVLSLATLTSLADAAPRKHRAPRRDSQWMRTCIHERTGPDGGIPVAEARTICRAEQPDDEVGAAKQQLAVARANAKITKAKERMHKAIEACEQAVVDACFAAESEHCEDTDLTEQFNLVCRAPDA